MLAITLSRLLAVLLSGACLVALLCGPVVAQDASLAPEASPTLAAESLEGAWDVLSFDAWGEGLVEPRVGTTLTAVFLPDGRLEGETGCGTYFGGYTLENGRLGMGVISKDLIRVIPRPPKRRSPTPWQWRP